jgi:RNA-splicing ligase RtcB
MGETSVILEGVENEEAEYSLYSTVHGAGRVMGRARGASIWAQSLPNSAGRSSIRDVACFRGNPAIDLNAGR